MLHASASWRNCRSGGFTMIELLVVIAVLALLIALVTAVASKAIGQQKQRNTQQIMQNVSLALEQFASENPLRAVYDRRGLESFGKYPPYQLYGGNPTGNSWTVRKLVEPDLSAQGEAIPPAYLSNRLWRDLGNNTRSEDNWVVIATPPGAVSYPDAHDDNRALYAYLKVFSPGSMNLIAENVIKPLYPQLDPDDRSYVNPKGDGTQPGDDGCLDVLGIHDAWGVPLDYMLYVKCEWRLPVGGTNPRFVITERRPVLRSRGIKREVYDAWVQSDPAAPMNRAMNVSPPEKWIFSEEFPQPWLGPPDEEDLSNDFLKHGEIDFTGTQCNGWVRAVALEEDYAYLPDGDDVEESP